MAYQFGSVVTSDRDYDLGLRAYLSRVYLKVTGGLIVSAVVAWAIAYVPALRALFFTSARGEVAGFTGLGLALLFSPLVVLFMASFVIRDHTARGTALLYWTVAALVGGSLSLLALTYTGATLVSTFLISASAFAALSLWGSATRRNLEGLGNFLVVALFGLIVAMMVNLFVHSKSAFLAMDVLGVLIFAGLIAADTQKLKRIYYEIADPETLEAGANFGALTLYLNFVNLFQLLLSLSGGRRLWHGHQNGGSTWTS